MTLEKGQKAPDFEMKTDGDGSISLSDFKGKKIVLYFYPKDDTSGCTKEACGFRDTMDELASKNVAVVGVSPDSVASHDKFKAKHELNFTLASDPDHEVAEKYGAWGEKKMYGKTYMGIIRSTFLIDEEGNIAETWYKVRVPGHVEKVKAATEGL
jgi:peroxiredoxin Q/BCP